MLLEAFVLGISGSLPLPRRSLTSVLVRREGEEFLFDCGEGMQVSLRLMHVRWKHLKVICISHSHADHVTGLPGLLMLSSQVDRDEPLLIVCPRAVKQFVEATITYLEIYLNYEIYFAVLEDIQEGRVYAHPEYSISAFKGQHSRAVWGFVLQEYPRAGQFHPEKAKELGIPMGELWADLQKGKTIEVDGKQIAPQEVLGIPRRGRKIVYITDTRPNKYISSQLEDADLVFCEAMFKHTHLEQAVVKKHMTSVEAATMIRDAGGVLKAGLLHFSPRYSNRDISELEAEAKQIYSPVFACQERSSLVIPYRD